MAPDVNFFTIDTATGIISIAEGATSSGDSGAYVLTLGLTDGNTSTT